MFVGPLNIDLLFFLIAPMMSLGMSVLLVTLGDGCVTDVGGGVEETVGRGGGDSGEGWR